MMVMRLSMHTQKNNVFCDYSELEFITWSIVEKNTFKHNRIVAVILFADKATVQEKEDVDSVDTVRRVSGIDIISGR